MGTRAIKVSNVVPGDCPPDFTMEYQMSLAIHKGLARDPLPAHLNRLFGFVVSHCFMHSRPPQSRCYLVMDLIRNYTRSRKLAPHRAYFDEGWVKDGPEIHKTELLCILARHKLITEPTAAALFTAFGQIVSWFLRNGIIPYDFQCLLGSFNGVTKLWIQDFGLYQILVKEPSKTALKAMAEECTKNGMEPQTPDETNAYFSNIQLGHVKSWLVA